MRNTTKFLGWLVLVAIVASLMAIFVFAPMERTMGVVQRIFYFHVAVAWVSFLAFFLVFLSSILFLWKKDQKWDILASSSAELGILFCGLTLITGSIWAKPVWYVWWTWDARLTTTLVLFLIYVAYWMLREFTTKSWQIAKSAAIFAIVGFVDVPIVFMSIRWWRTQHPGPVIGQRMGLTPSMLFIMLLSLGAITLLFVYLLKVRIKLEKINTGIDKIQRRIQEENL